MKQEMKILNPSARAAALILVLLFGYAFTATAQTKEDLAVQNGDFSDPSDMGSADVNGWRSGVPVGWMSTSKDPTNPVDVMYAVNDQCGPTPPVCNVSQLMYLQQVVGTLTKDADVLLEFDVVQAWGPAAQLDAAILDGNQAPLANEEFMAGQKQQLLARNVPAGTKITIQFWVTKGTTPGLDNVTVKTFAPGKAPEAARKP
jgi:hypothetical protein